MPTFDVYPTIGTQRLDRFQARDLKEAIALTYMRLEGQDVELWQDGNPAVVVPMFGQLMLTDRSARADRTEGRLIL